MNYDVILRKKETRRKKMAPKENYLRELSIFKFLITCFTLIQCHSINDTEKLLENKLKFYNKGIRPRTNQSSAVILSTYLSLLSIQEYDEVQEKLTVTAFVSVSWTDDNMKWNETEYGGQIFLIVDSNSVWTPDLVLLNNINKLEKIGDAWHKVRFESDGTAHYYPGDVFSASCKVDISFYPWDKHRCALQFGVWAFSPSEVQIKSEREKVEIFLLTENGAWIVTDTSAEAKFLQTQVEFSLCLERKPQFIMINVIIPFLFMSFLNVMIFLIPVETGERVSYSITVLLACTVFLTIIGENLPKTSNPMSFFSYYLLSTLMINIGITMGTIFTLRLYYCVDTKPIGGRWLFVLNVLRFSSNKRNRSTEDIITGNFSDQNEVTRTNETLAKESDNSENSKAEKADKLDDHEQCQGRLRGSNCHVKEHIVHTNKQKEMTKPKNVITWKDISVKMDICLFIVFAIALTISTSLFFGVMLLTNRTC